MEGREREREGREENTIQAADYAREWLIKSMCGPPIHERDRQTTADTQTQAITKKVQNSTFVSQKHTHLPLQIDVSTQEMLSYMATVCWSLEGGEMGGGWGAV